MAGTGRRTARGMAKGPADEYDTSSGHRKPVNRLRKSRTRDPNFIRILNTNPKAMLGLGFVALFVIWFLVHRFTNHAEEPQKPRSVTPLPAPKVMDLPQFKGEHRESLYWGTYRPQVYFGIRARTPRSLVAGLMWIGIKDGQYILRHMCNNADDLSRYGWQHHNGRDYGHQTLVDQDMTLATSFLKSKGSGSGYGGDWAVRIDVQSKKSMVVDEDGRSRHVFFYLADEDEKELNFGSDNLEFHGNSVLATGSRMDVGQWQLHLESREHMEIHYTGFRTSNLHNLSDLVQQNVGTQARSVGRLQLSDSSDDSPNILVFQISARVPFVTDIAFVSGTSLEGSRTENRVHSLTGNSLTSQITKKQGEFESKFEGCFDITNKLDSEIVNVGKAAVSNLLGGLGYFYGQSKIAIPESADLKNANTVMLYWPAELFTAVPSRPFFPRGFLWDEGFHQLLIWKWDVRMSLDIIGHWLDLMNIDGWIPREQILGPEALSKVPDEFVPQHPTNGNPPTLFLVLREIVCALNKEKFTASESKEISTFLDRALVRLETWFNWFNTTQSGKQVGDYFWHGRDDKTARELNPKTLSSGLDDYPRASHPSDEERHLDLRCWMLLAADCIHSITKILQKADVAGKKEYLSTAKLLSDFENLNQKHFDDASGAYFDFGNHTEKVKLSWKVAEPDNIYSSRELVREVLQRPGLRLVPHIGYVSLFPFMGRIIPPDSWILGKQLDLISNRSMLWTDYGLRSLSRTSSFYMKRNTEHDPPYWRGPVWMNMNYMILSALRYYSEESGPYRDRARSIYDDLRGNLIRNVVHNYYQTGYFWEQYDQKNGKGKGTRMFTGWTSLVLLIMAESYGENLGPSIL